MFLRQSTTQTIRFGPSLDETDGVTEKTGLTLAQSDMRISKDGGAFAQKSASGNATHDSDGWYSTTLSTTDTNTVGELIINIHQPANMLPIWQRYWVIEEAIYDAMFGASAAGFDSNGRIDVGRWIGTAVTLSTGSKPDVNVNEWADVLLATTNPLPNAVAGAAGGIFIAGTNAATTVTTSFTTTFTGKLTGNVDGTVASVVSKTGYALVSTGADLILKSSTFALAMADAIWDETQTSHTSPGSFGEIATEIASILVDTGTDLPQEHLDTQNRLVTILEDTEELQTAWTNGGRLDDLIDAILVDTGTTIVDHLTDIKGTSFVKDTHSLIDITGFVDLIDNGTSGLAKIASDVAAIPTTAMRGTENAALATVATEARLAELDAGRLPADIDNILVDTAEIGSEGAGLTDLGGMSTGMKGQVKTEVDTAFTTQMADSVPADGTIMTREQALYATLQFLTDFAISGTTYTVKKVDGSTALMTFTLDDSTSPTSLTRAT